jgi:hypothetical protein
MKPIINAVLFAVAALVIVIMWPFIGTSSDDEDDRDD